MSGGKLWIVINDYDIVQDMVSEFLCAAHEGFIYNISRDLVTDRLFLIASLRRTLLPLPSPARLQSLEVMKPNHGDVLGSGQVGEAGVLPRLLNTVAK